MTGMPHISRPYRQWFFPLLLCIPFALTGQGNWEIAVNSHFGKIAKHSSKIQFTKNDIGISHGLDFNLQYQTLGKQEWQARRRYPKMGVALVYYAMGNRDITGYAIGILPNITTTLLRRPRGHIGLQVGFGLSYLSQHYDPIKNTFNTAIGSHWNAEMLTRFTGGFHIHEQWEVLMGGGINHYSNGASQLPNLGLNILEGSIGLRYHFVPTAAGDYIPRPTKRKPEQRWGGDLHFDLAYREYQAYGGPRFPVYIGEGAGTFRLNHVNKIGVGLSAEYNVGAYYFTERITSGMTHQELRAAAARLAVFLQDEVQFGDFGLRIAVGYYLHRGEQIPTTYYNKVGVRYALPPVGKHPTRFYALVSLKIHSSVADYVSFGFGAAF